MRLTTVSACSIVVLSSNVWATVSSTMVADTYLVADGTKTYSVLDIYVKGSHVGDTMAGVSGLSGTSGHAVVFATSKATGTGLTRDTSGKITAGSINSDIFVQAGNSSWTPNYSSSNAGGQWDSFIASGNRKQNATVTNRAGALVNMASGWITTTTFGGGQMITANSNFIENGGNSGWLNNGNGANPFLSGTTPLATENPFARLSLYNSTWDSTYTDLDRAGVTTVKGSMQNGRAAATGAVVVGTQSLDFCWMIGRFAIDTASFGAGETITMNAQFNMVGKNGTSTEAGTTFTGAITASYKVSNFFTFQPVPGPGAAALIGLAGALVRRRRTY